MQKKKGISLIVLVITIIVMIILAASVVISLNNTGVIEKANTAVKLTDEGQVQDLAALVWAEAYLDDDRTDPIETVVKEKLAEQGITEDDWDITVSNTGVNVKAKGSKTVITFTIGGTSYQATQGMTWTKWLASSYNTANYTTPVINTADTVGISYETAIVASTAYEFITDTCWTSSDNIHYHDGQKYTGWCGADYWNDGVWEAGCFVEGTQVLMADKTTKNIEDMKVGDKVVSYNRLTGEFYTTTVVKTMKEEVTNAYYEIQLEDGTILGATGNHPILTDIGFECIFGESADAEICGKLEVGDNVLTTDGYKKILSIIRREKKVKIYNLSVADDEEIETGIDNDEDDTYVVEGVVCHNHV